MNPGAGVETATRIVYWHIGPVWLMYLLTVVSFGVFGWGLYRRARLWRAVGQPTPPLGQVAARLAKVWREIGLHRRFFRDGVAGTMHAALFWSMALLFVGTLVVMAQVDFGLPVMRGWFYLVFQKLVLNLAGLFVALGCVVALVRRYGLKVARLQPNRPQAAPDPSHGLAPAWLLLVVLQGFALQAIRLAANPDPFAAWAPVGHALSLGLAGIDPATLVTAYQTVWWFHLVTVLGWVAWLPYGKMLHLFTGPLNVYSGQLDERPRVPAPIDFENVERLGVSKIQHFSWKDLQDLDACTSCGRCQQACPAFASGAPLSPRSLVLDLRDHLRTHGPALAAAGEQADALEGVPALVGQVITDDVLWACTTCASCVQECPVHIEHVPKVIEMRRHAVMEESRLPATMQDALKSLEDRAHPYKGVNGDRTEWSKGLAVPLATEVDDYDVLYWVGCTASFDPRAQKVARSLVELLQMADVKVAVLGNDEPCCGDPARRMGHEFLYDALAKGNVELLQSVAPKRIVTACPHCFNALGNEYRPFGATFDVVHHTQFLKELVDDGRLVVEADAAAKVTYHDPCYLGRYNREFDAPRALLGAAGPAPVEMERHHDNSLCCGGGGGQAWMPTPPGRKTIRINEIRANQAAETGADTLAVSCPFCIRMMEDGVKAAGHDDQLKVRDVAEVLLAAAHPRPH